MESLFMCDVFGRGVKTEKASGYSTEQNEQ